MPESQRLASVVFRLDRDKMESLKSLSRSTRIRQSEYLREAIADLLSKHEVRADGLEAALLTGEWRNRR
jgi:predicted transcriptional regulator